MARTELTPTSYIILGLLSQAVELSPYGLKQLALASVGHLWTIPHSQIYAEPARLARAGYLLETQERSGRRRKRYAITDKGRWGLEAWTSTPTDELPELRDLALMKVLFGGDAKELAPPQLDAHERKLATYRQMLATMPAGAPSSWRYVLEAGMRYQREWVGFWSDVIEGRFDPVGSPR